MTILKFRNFRTTGSPAFFSDLIDM